jgi:hypothetical protein
MRAFCPLHHLNSLNGIHFRVYHFHLSWIQLTLNHHDHFIDPPCSALSQQGPAYLARPLRILSNLVDCSASPRISSSSNQQLVSSVNPSSKTRHPQPGRASLANSSSNNNSSKEPLAACLDQRPISNQAQVVAYSARQISNRIKHLGVACLVTLMPTRARLVDSLEALVLIKAPLEGYLGTRLPTKERQVGSLAIPTWTKARLAASSVTPKIKALQVPTKGLQAVCLAAQTRPKAQLAVCLETLRTKELLVAFLATPQTKERVAACSVVRTKGQAAGFLETVPRIKEEVEDSSGVQIKASPSSPSSFTTVI